MPRRGPYRVRDTAQIEALASPVRMQVVHAFLACQPCTVKEVAAHMGRLPESLYYHVRALAKVGLLVEQGRRPTLRQDEAVYELVGCPLKLEPDRRSEADVAAMRKLGAGILRLAERVYSAAVEDPDVDREGRRRGVALGQRTVRLSERGLERINAKLEELFELLGEEHTASGDRLFTVTIGLAPNVLHKTDRE